MTAIGIAMVFNVILTCCASSTQESAELAFILSYNPMDDVSRGDDTHTRIKPPYTPGIKFLLTGAIRFYQLFISTQDMPACNFVPSCSQFGAESLRQMGILRGILLTSDRLQRCNSMSTSRYRMDYKSGRFIDPVQIYRENFQ